MGATVRREGGTFGGASGEWVEETESRAIGRSGRQDQEVGGWSHRRVGEEEDGVKQAEAETNPRAGKEDEDDHDDDWTASRSIIYRPCSAGRGAAPKRCIVTRIGCSHWAPAMPEPGVGGQVGQLSWAYDFEGAEC